MALLTGGYVADGRRTNGINPTIFRLWPTNYQKTLIIYNGNEIEKNWTKSRTQKNVIGHCLGPPLLISHWVYSWTTTRNDNRQKCHVNDQSICLMWSRIVGWGRGAGAISPVLHNICMLSWSWSTNLRTTMD